MAKESTRTPRRSLVNFKVSEPERLLLERTAELLEESLSGFVRNGALSRALGELEEEVQP